MNDWWSYETVKLNFQQYFVENKLIINDVRNNLWDDDDICFSTYRHVELEFYLVSLLKQHTTWFPLVHIILLLTLPMLSLFPLNLVEKKKQILKYSFWSERLGITPKTFRTWAEQGGRILFEYE